MALVLVSKPHQIVKIGDAYVSIKFDRGNLKLVIDAPKNDAVLRQDVLKEKLESHGWTLLSQGFQAGHPVHGTMHIREAEEIIDGHKDATTVV